MRRSAYMKAIQQAKQLPTEIPELSSYFKDGYNPQAEALRYITKKAREDADGLFHGEFVDVYNAARDTSKDKSDGYFWWCNSHRREATHINSDGRPCCDPNLGGSIRPCQCVAIKKANV